MLAFAAATWFSGATIAAGEDTSDHALPRRVAWHNTRLNGTPEPPPPYTVEKTFTKIKWTKPLYIAPVPGSHQLLVVLQGGESESPAKILRLDDDPETDHVETLLQMERRLIYGLTFHPRYESNGFLFVFSNGPWDKPGRGNRVSRFTVGASPPFACDPKSEVAILEWQSAGHDGGDLAFGKDVMLYITAGDGSTDSDTLNSGQDISNLLATLIRIDVDHPSGGRRYSVPADNPFLHVPGARPEIWAYGFRNPWRMCADVKTGDLWVGNNGQDQWELAHLVHRGDNFGWSVYEGSHPFYLQRQRGPTPIVRPTIEHPHSEFRSLTGGVVYYGEKLPELGGAYIYGDYSTGKIWGARQRDGQLTWSQELADTSLQIAAFRVDQRGELLVVDHGGGLYRLVRQMPDPARAPFPNRLSETGLFASTAEHRPAAGLIPYSVNAAGWADGATAERYIALPDDSKIKYASERGWNFPDGAVLMQTLAMQREAGSSASRRRIETRLLVRQQNEWAGYSYRWNDEQTDAVLVARSGEDRRLALGAEPAGPGETPRSWRFPSRAECLACHSRAANFVLGLSELQLDRAYDYGGAQENQLRALDRLGVFTSRLPNPLEKLGKLVDPYAAAEPLEARARSYLHANCSMCHIESGGGNARMELEVTTRREKVNLSGARPQHDTFGIQDAMLVAPGSPERSVLLYRLSHRGRGQMPPLVTSAVDERAVSLMREWIAQMKPERPFVRDWQLKDLVPALDKVKSGRSLESGKAAFRDTGCVQCHRFAGEGGSVGPDLSGIGRRLKVESLLESIVLPSKTIPTSYATTVLVTKDGKVVTGRIEKEDKTSIVIRTELASAESVTVRKDDIERRSLSQTSNMPAGIINVLERDQVLDLLAYLQSDTKENERADAK